MHQTAVAANGHIDTCLFHIFVACLCHVDQCGSLSAADTLLFTGDTDGTATDTHLDEIGSGFDQVVETFLINNISGTDQHFVTIRFLDPLQCCLLPFGIAVGRVDTQYIDTRFNQRRNTFHIVACVDPRAYEQFLIAAGQLFRIVAVAVVVFAEDEILQVLFFVDDRQRVQFVIPDDLVGFTQCHAQFADDQFGERSHEFFHLLVGRILFGTIVATGHHTQQFTVRSTVVRHTDRRVFGALYQSDYICQRIFRRQIGVADYKTGFELLYFPDHFGLAVDRL